VFVDRREGFIFDGLRLVMEWRWWIFFFVLIILGFLIRKKLINYSLSVGHTTSSFNSLVSSL